MDQYLNITLACSLGMHVYNLGISGFAIPCKT